MEPEANIFVEILGGAIIKICPNVGCEDLTPVKAHDDDAGYDLRAAKDCVVLPHNPIIVSAGFKMEIPVGYEAQIRSRSGMAAKFGVFVLNSPGTIDSGYRGDVGVILFKPDGPVYEIKRGDKIAQMVINKLPSVRLEITDQLSETKRGKGGFGSTGA